MPAHYLSPRLCPLYLPCAQSLLCLQLLLDLWYQHSTTSPQPLERGLYWMRQEKCRFSTLGSWTTSRTERSTRCTDGALCNTKQMRTPRPNQRLPCSSTVPELYPLVQPNQVRLDGYCCSKMLILQTKMLSTWCCTSCAST